MISHCWCPSARFHHTARPGRLSCPARRLYWYASTVTSFGFGRRWRRRRGWRRPQRDGAGAGERDPEPESEPELESLTRSRSRSRSRSTQAKGPDPENRIGGEPRSLCTVLTR